MHRIVPAALVNLVLFALHNLSVGLSGGFPGGFPGGVPGGLFGADPSRFPDDPAGILGNEIAALEGKLMGTLAGGPSIRNEQVAEFDCGEEDS